MKALQLKESSWEMGNGNTQHDYCWRDGDLILYVSVDRFMVDDSLRRVMSVWMEGVDPEGNMNVVFPDGRMISTTTQLYVELVDLEEEDITRYLEEPYTLMSYMVLQCEQ